MDSRGQSGGVKFLVALFRSLTRVAQILPFAYLLVFALYLFLERFIPEGALAVIDSVLYPSPAVTGLFLLMSRSLKLCAWHKAACLLPSATSVESYIDSYVITFTQGEVIAVNAVTGMAFVIFLIIAIRHFFYGRKEDTLRNP